MPPEAALPPAPAVPAQELDRVVLTYWHDRLIEEDLSSSVRSKVRIFFGAKHLLKKTFSIGKAVGGNDDRQEALRLALTCIRERRSPERIPEKGARGQQEASGQVELQSAEMDLAGRGRNAEKTEPTPIWILLLEGHSRPSVVIQSSDDRRKLSEIDFLLAIPAMLSDDDRVLPPSERDGDRPVIERRRLEPQPNFDDLPTPVGFFEDWVEQRARLRAETDELDEWVAACLAAFREVSAGTRNADLACIVPRQPGFATYWPAKAMNALMEISEAPDGPSLLPPLVKRVLGLAGGTKTVCAIDQLDTRGLHSAMVDRLEGGERVVDPLNAEQRKALHALLSLDGESGLVAVSGPPGTGKTAMLRAMIATRWVNAAISGAPCPITICCGPTNQSVTNVLGTFENCLPSVGNVAGMVGFRHRWLFLKKNADLNLKWQFLAASAPSKAKRVSLGAMYPTIERLQGDDEEMESIHWSGLASELDRSSPTGNLALAANWAGRLAAALSRDSEFGGYFSSGVAVEAEAAADRLMGRRKGIDRGTTWKNAEAVATACAKEMIFLTESLRGALHEAKMCADRLAARLTGQGKGSATLEAVKEICPNILLSHATVVKIGSLAELLKGGTIEEFDLVEAVLDVTVRPSIFHLAARYWEGRWIIQKLAGGNRRETHIEHLRAISMLAPCIASTLHNVPRFVREKASSFPFGEVDLVVLDEAGQATPELAVPVLSLARCAVVVGDLKQLAPVAKLSPEEDERIVADLGKMNIEEWRARGVDAASGSAMRLAATSASFKDPDPSPAQARAGLLLREHYRCARSIISFCVDLMYHEHDRRDDASIAKMELKPMSPDPEFGQLSAMNDPRLTNADQRALAIADGFRRRFPVAPLSYHVTGGVDDVSEKTDSWTNRGEAEAIVQWLATEGREIARWLAIQEWVASQGELEGAKTEIEKDLADVVGIVTPFRGQAEEIRRLVRIHLDPIFGTVDDVWFANTGRKHRLSERMKIGTVHTLQGAEVPIVVFSAVNESEPSRESSRKRVFMDRDEGRLLNVAMSRAKKAFILFGNADLFFSKHALAPETELPSALLGRWMAGVDEGERSRRNGITRLQGVRIGPDVVLAVWSRKRAQECQSAAARRSELQVVALEGFSEATPSKAPAKEIADRVASRILNAPTLVVDDAPLDGEGEKDREWLSALREHRWFETIGKVVLVSDAGTDDLDQEGNVV